MKLTEDLCKLSAARGVCKSHRQQYPGHIVQFLQPQDWAAMLKWSGPGARCLKEINWKLIPEEEAMSLFFQ